MIKSEPSTSPPPAILLSDDDNGQESAYSEGILDIDDLGFPSAQERHEEGLLDVSEEEEVIEIDSDPQTPIEEQAMALEFSELLRLVAARTSFSIGNPAVRKSSQPRMGAQFVPDDAPNSYVALSSSAHVLECAEAARSTAAEHQFANKPAHFSPPGYNRSKIKQFCFSDELIVTQPAAHPESPLPDWMSSVHSTHRSFALDKDLAGLEQSQREMLAAVSYLDALQTASFNIVRDLNNPVLLRMIMVSANALLEICQRATFALQQLTTHRRDMWLLRPTTTLTPEQFAMLRHAPCIGSTALFDPALIRRISSEQLSRATEKLTMRAYMQPHQQAPAARRQQPQQRPQQRGQNQQRQLSQAKRASTSAPQGQRPPKQQRPSFDSRRVVMPQQQQQQPTFRPAAPRQDR